MTGKPTLTLKPWMAAGQAIAPLVKALELIDEGECERTTGGGYNCQADPSLLPDAFYSADRWCNSCIAHAALALARGEAP